MRQKIRTEKGTRRSFLKDVLVCSAGVALPWRPLWGDVENSSAPDIRHTLKNADWEGPVSRSFGLASDGHLLDASSMYKVPKDSTDRLSFDFSNNQIACVLDCHGLLKHAVVEMGVVPSEAAATPVGAYVDKVLVRGGPWPVSLQLGGEAIMPLNELPPPSIFLRENLFPLVVWQHRELEIRLLAFAPMRLEAFPAPRGIIAIIGLKNKGTTFVEGHLGVSTDAEHEHGVFLEQTHAGTIPEKFRFGLQGGELVEIPLGFALGAHKAELDSTVAMLRQKTSKEWFAQTLTAHTNRYGQLSIPEGMYFSELYQRAGELTRQSLLSLPDGSFGGGFNGSDLPQPTTVWMRDCLYASLPQSFLCPDLCAEAILFFLKWGVPSRLLGPGISRFPNAMPVTNSLGNSVAGLVLAGAYYQMTGDSLFFQKHPEILVRGTEILNEVLASRREEPYLFPSLYVSDGDARGDFHTGSNIIVWRAFKSMARLAREVFHVPALADSWDSLAEKIQEAIWNRCAVIGTLGSQFVEGVMADYSFTNVHDGEESDTTLMPFYGFCASDHPAYLNRARLAVTPENPYFFKKEEGIWWYAHGRWSSATFPGWMTALAGAQTEEEVLSRLQRIRSLTDADGSFWWWPYRHDAPEATLPSRANVKCGWAAGVFTCLFTNTILGITVDVPSAKVALRPFSPWNEFHWTNCRFGTRAFDLHYKKYSGVIMGQIKNLNRTDFEGEIELLLPGNARVISCLIDGKSTDRYQIGSRYSRKTVKVLQRISPGQELNVQAIFANA